MGAKAPEHGDGGTLAAVNSAHPPQPTDPAEVEALTRPARYPRSAQYDPPWVLDLDMGLHPLWQLEDLLDGESLRPGMRVLDVGAGKGASSVFLANEYGVDVVAVDLWVDPDEARAVAEQAGVADRITRIRGDIRTVPLDRSGFDAVVAVDCFEYFGTDVHFLPRLVPALKPGALLAMSTPALRSDPYAEPVPPLVRAAVGWESAAWHTPSWWARHWELSGLLDDVCARWQRGGGQDWLLWARARQAHLGETGPDPVIDMMAADATEQIGIALVTGRRRQ